MITDEDPLRGLFFWVGRPTLSTHQVIAAVCVGILHANLPSPRSPTNFPLFTPKFSTPTRKFSTLTPKSQQGPPARANLLLVTTRLAVRIMIFDHDV